MTTVVDASIALRWVLKDERPDRSYDLLRDDRVIAPDLVLAEITNAIWKAVKYAALPSEVAAQAVSEAEIAFDELVPSRELKDRALEIAVALGHPAYDCFYLALAEQRQCQLVTADDRLIRRCADTPHSKLLRPL